LNVYILKRGKKARLYVSFWTFSFYCLFVLYTYIRKYIPDIDFSLFLFDI